MQDPLLARFLAGRDVPCPQCGYNLRDLIGDRCPECGEPLILHLGLVEPRQKLLIAGLVGLSAGAGMSGLLLVYAAIQVALELTRGGRIYPSDWRFAAIASGGLIVEGPAVLLWLARWRRIRRAGLGPRAALVLGCWGLTLANLLVFALDMK